MPPIEEIKAFCEKVGYINISNKIKEHYHVSYTTTVTWLQKTGLDYKALSKKAQADRKLTELLQNEHKSDDKEDRPDPAQTAFDKEIDDQSGITQAEQSACEHGAPFDEILPAILRKEDIVEDNINPITQRQKFHTSQGPRST